MAAKRAKPRAWQRMLSGRRLDLLDPSPLDIEIEDIAHGLARVARWNGQTHGAHIFSVAQHSVLVETVASELFPDFAGPERLAVLLHDAAEYVIGDLISPFKAVLGGDYKTVELRIQAAVHLRFGLKPELDASLKAGIKRADSIAAYFEATRLAGFEDKEARRFFGAPPALGDSVDLRWLEPVSATEAESAFLDRFGALFED